MTDRQLASIDQYLVQRHFPARQLLQIELSSPICQVVTAGPSIHLVIRKLTYLTLGRAEKHKYTKNSMANPQVQRPFCKSVLQVQVPVVVTLARKSMQLDQVLKLVPGMMIQFEKPFDAPMSLEVDDQPIAEGDVVKAGDKFAIRITQVSSPSERFVNLTRSASTS